MIGDRVRQLRQAKKLSQEKLAERIGVTQTALSQIETGHTKTLKAETLMRLAAALDEHPEYIRTGRRMATKPTDAGLAEATAIAVYRRLTPQNQQTWLALGETLAAQQLPARKVQGHPVGQPQNKNPVLDSIVATLSQILARHGPDVLARAIADLEVAARQPEPSPPPASKRSAAKSGR